ncbi:protein ligase [Roseibium sp. MMSF_3412]|uniref:lipoyl protein ligase domain-containing protein n=1 Tax=Roseibium sp. MMSF_3412 TaxID=3046712 RepID=UPI00273F97BB|nr:protein ligase [Roseibium sp. MMSF_3412]
MIDFLDASEALAREMDLLEDVSRDPGRRHLWFWESPKCLVAPKSLSSKPGFERAAIALEADGWPVSLRSTGGDVTPQGTGILNVSHVYATEPGEPVDLKREYDRLCTPIEKALGAGAGRGWQPGAFCDGEFNVQLNNRKFAGTAMRIRRGKADRKRSAILAHAIMLIDPVSIDAIGAINRFLSLLGEDRRIDAGAHASLPAGYGRENFVAALSDAFLDQV